MSVAGGHHPFGGDCRKGIRNDALRIQLPRVRSQVLYMNPKVVEYFQQVILQIRLPLLFTNSVNYLLSSCGPERIKLQETVASLLENISELRPRRGGPPQE